MPVGHTPRFERRYFPQGFASAEIRGVFLFWEYFVFVIKMRKVLISGLGGFRPLAFCFGDIIC